MLKISIINNYFLKECNSCKKRGATLTCSKLDCTKSYHYPCAILSSKLFTLIILKFIRSDKQ